MHLKFLLIRILVCTIGDISLFLFCNFAAANANIPANDITVGSQVCMRKAPIYHAGSIGYTVSGGIPKVGQLLNSAWNITDTCRFKMIQPPKRPKLPELPREKDKQKEDYDSASMPPPPSPASSTCSGSYYIRWKNL